MITQRKHNKISTYIFGSVRRKLISVFLVVVIIPITLTSIFSYLFLKSVVEEKVDSASNMVIRQTAMSIDRIMRDMITATNILIQDDEIVDVLSLDEADLQEAYLLRDLKIIGKIDKLQQSMMDVYLTNLVALRDVNSHIYTNVLGSDDEKVRVIGSLINKINQYEDDANIRSKNIKWGKEAFRINISGTHDEGFDESYIAMVRQFIGVDFRRSKGDILIGVPEYEFSKILLGLITNQGVSGYLVDNSGYVLSSTDHESIGKYLIQNSTTGSIDQNSDNSIILNDNESIVNSIQLDRTNWYIMQVIPKTVIYAEINATGTFIIIIGALSIILFIFVSFGFSRGITLPIYRLNNASKDIAAGHFELIPKSKWPDEITQLSENFNVMAQKIKDSIEKTAEDERIKRELEIQVLYAQINPHFLFNTLNSARWMADASGASNVSELIVALASLLKSSIINKNQYVTVSEEIENVKNYVSIQKIRYSSKFDIEYSISPEISEYLTLKLVLQPLVENSIIHGFKNKDFGGKIKITGYKHDDKIIIEVKDNGVGMDEKKIEELLTDRSLRQIGFSGIGVRNVNDRLILHFGKEYSLVIISEKGEGATTRITFPLLRDGNNNV